MALHFRRLVAIVMAEYISQLNKKSMKEISLIEYDNFLETLKKPRATISRLVDNVMSTMQPQTL